MNCDLVLASGAASPDETGRGVEQLARSSSLPTQAAKPLTTRAQQLLGFLLSFSAEHGRAPRLTECRDHMLFVTVAPVLTDLRALVEGGWVDVDADSRSVTVRSLVATQ